MRFPGFSYNWTLCKLSDVSGHLEYGIGASAINFNGKHRYIRITDVSNWGKNKITSPSFIEKSAMLNDGDILLARTGATVGDSFIYKDDGVESYFAGFLIRAKVQKANPYFVYYQLKTQKYAQWVKISSARSGQPGINSEQFGSYRICLTEHNEQQKIANFLKAIDERIETQNKIIEEIKSQIFSISYIMVKSISKTIPIKEICIFEEKTKHQSGDGLLEGYYPFFTNEEETVKYFDTYDFDGEYIIANTGGKANFKYHNGKFATMSDCLVIKIRNTSLTSFYSIVFSVLQKYIDYIGFEGSGLKHLNKDWFLKFQVPQCDENAEKFICMINDLKEKLQIEKDILSLYKKQKTYLLQNMFI